MIEVRNARMAWKTGASVVVGGVFVCRDCSGSDSGNGDASELFRIAGVDRISGDDACSGVFEAEVCGGSASGSGWDGVGVCENCK